MSYAWAGSEPMNLCLENGGRNVRRKEEMKEGEKWKYMLEEAL